MPHSPRRQLEAVIRNNGRHLARCLIRRGRYIIGQDRKNEIVVDEESMSSTHARLTVVTDDEIYIEDLDSANGTLVNGAPVTGSMRVTSHCSVQLGQNTLEFQRGGLPAATFEYLPEGFLRSHRYLLGDLVVQGRTSAIYQAQDTSLGRAVAYKLMLPESQASTPHVLRFIREAQIASQLQHPAIPPVYELSVDEQSRLFYTTRFVEGETLGAILDGLHAGDPGVRERFTLSGLLGVFQKICDGVAFAHSSGVVHGSLRPDNIVVGDFGEVFVTTWGSALVLPPALDADGAPSPRSVHAPEGTGVPPLSPYSAPEQATESYDKMGFSTDIYALGAILYRIIFLQDAISAENDEELLSRILMGEHTQPSALAKPARAHWPGGKMPDRLATLAMRALSASPADRPATVRELQRGIA